MTSTRTRALLAGLISLVMLACLLPPALASSVSPLTRLTVNGHDFTIGTAEQVDFPGNGTAVYDGSHTLTLKSVTLDGNTATSDRMINARGGELTIVLEGENKITNGGGYGISASSLTIRGDGNATLAVRAAGSCLSGIEGAVVENAALDLQQLGTYPIIHAGSGAVTLKNGANVSLSGKERGDGIFADSVRVEGKSALTMQGPFVDSSGIQAYGGITVDDSEMNIAVTAGNGESALYPTGSISIQNGSTVTLTSSSQSWRAIQGRGDLAVTGGSTLSITTTAAGAIYVEGKIAIQEQSEVTVAANTGNPLIYSLGEMVIQKSTLTATNQGEGEALYKAGSSSDALSILDSKVTATTNGTIAISVAGPLTVERSELTAQAVKDNSSWDSALEVYGDLSIRNAAVSAAGGDVDESAIHAYNITLEDAAGHPASEVIADGGIKPNGDIIIRPAPDTWMQAHASEQAGGAVTFESYFDQEKTFYKDGELSPYGYVQIKAHTHAFTAAKWDETDHWQECVCGARDGVTPHAFSPNWTQGETTHWHECVCGARQGEAEHAPADAWEYDGVSHWHPCAVCGVKLTSPQPHTFAWVTDKEPTPGVPGSRHEQCATCAYAKAPAAIPALPTPTASAAGSANVPKTGDNTPLALWLMLLLASGAAVAVLGRRKPSNR